MNNTYVMVSLAFLSGNIEHFDCWQLLKLKDLNSATTGKAFDDWTSSEKLGSLTLLTPGVHHAPAVDGVDNLSHVSRLCKRQRCVSLNLSDYFCANINYC